jgi:hypothetical protein
VYDSWVRVASYEEELRPIGEIKISNRPKPTNLENP